VFDDSPNQIGARFSSDKARIVFDRSKHFPLVLFRGEFWDLVDYESKVANYLFKRFLRIRAGV
jgi:hypothetical protein